MNRYKLKLYFSLILLIVVLILGAAFFIFSAEKNNTLNKTIRTYHKNSTKLIADKVFEDLLLDNFLEAQRKLNLLKEQKIIDDFQISKEINQTDDNINFCENIFFDKNIRINPWGSLCITYPNSSQGNNLINLKKLSFIFVFLVFFVMLLVFISFKKIKTLNEELYLGIEQILNKNNHYMIGNSFWYPVLTELTKLVDLNMLNEHKLFEQKIEIEKIELANQVAHDIRAPLATLDNIDLENSLSKIDIKLIREAIKRLGGITNSLLKNEDLKKSDVVEKINLQNAINNIIQAKRVEFPERNIETIPYNENSFANINEIKFETIISNLLTNAIEASATNSIVKVELVKNFQSYVIIISDQGKGIPPELVLKLGSEKITFDKSHGNGLGIFSAMSIVKSWGGSIEINSMINLGTSVKINLPAILENNLDPLNVLLDNDELVCMTWEYRAKKNGINLNIYKKSTDMFADKFLFSQNTNFYIDSELDNEKGEEVIHKLHKMGFLNLNICSGHPRDKFAHIPFIKKVISKSPPF